MQKPIITIDGPCGAGKTSSAKALASRLGMTCLDTDGIYRTIAYACKPYMDIMNNGSDDDKKAVLDRIVKTGIAMEANSESETTVFRLGEQRLEKEIRTAEISALTSALSVYRQVHEAANNISRTIAAAGNLVAEGRNMGDMLFPEADVKFYLIASPDKRAARRFNQAPEQYESLQEAARDTILRDHQDMRRSINPLRCPETAIIVNNTRLTLDETVQTLYTYAMSALITKALT